ncbi:hypothetical protein HDU96_005121 [Phlyctochytrium bullatum]|nr:hypothetical protein HDU96_005121 [Phlyctochytrium bullatum]
MLRAVVAVALILGAAGGIHGVLSQSTSAITTAAAGSLSSTSTSRSSLTTTSGGAGTTISFGARISTSPTSRPLARLEPPDGKIVLGAWLNTEDMPGARDSPRAFNERIGFNAGSFQLSQQMPLADNPFIPGDKLYANMSLLDDRTNASLLLTIYPYSGLDKILDVDITYLVDQCINISRTGRNVYIRFGPEMNGAWMQGYGVRPTEYKAAFRRVALRIHAETSAAMVWAPNLDQSGDSFSDYYPGDDVVDWVGLSVYWKGARGRYPWIVSRAAPIAFVAEVIDGLGNEGNNYSFYNNFAVSKGKPFMITEGGGAYHVDCKGPGADTFIPCATETDRSTPSMSFYNSVLFSRAFRASYPLVKMVHMFEFQKEESDGGYSIIRDFRATTDNATLALFRAGLQQFQDGFQWAAAAALPITATGAVSSASISEIDGGSAAVGETQPRVVIIAAAAAGGVLLIVVLVFAGILLQRRYRAQRVASTFADGGARNKKSETLLDPALEAGEQANNIETTTLVSAPLSAEPRRPEPAQKPNVLFGRSDRLDPPRKSGSLFSRSEPGGDQEAGEELGLAFVDETLKPISADVKLMLPTESSSRDAGGPTAQVDAARVRREARRRVGTMSAEEVSQRFLSQGFSVTLVSALDVNQIDGVDLLALGDEDLVSMGIEDQRARAAVLQGVKDLVTAEEVRVAEAGEAAFSIRTEALPEYSG